MASPHLNNALYVNQAGQFTVRSNSGPDNVLADEMLVENIFSGVNPADVRHATHLGIRSTVLGYDFCGRVISSPTGSKFREGDIVAGYTPSGMRRPPKYGTHQSRIACPENMAFKVPPSLPKSHAAALPVVVMTAADAIFNLFKLPLPTQPAESLRPILIWGASTSVGICALQFAQASGCRNIIVTASPARHGLLKQLGATHALDYSSPTVISDVSNAVDLLGQGPISHAFDAAGTMGNSPSASMVAQCATDPGTVLASVVFQQDKRFQMPVAMTKDEWEIHPPGAPGPVRIPARSEHHWHAWEALLWAVENYGQGFQLPSVQVFQGTAEDALQQIIKVENGESGFGKIVIEQPMK